MNENEVIETPATENIDTTPIPQADVEVIGIKFKEAGKIYYFDPNGNKITTNDHVIVETIRGVEYGHVALGNTMVKAEEIIPPLKQVIRIATKDDDLRYEKNLELEKDAFGICQSKIAAHNLDMKLISAEYTFDNNKLIFYFSSEDRVDFRELVKDLAAVFHTRIELRQIGIRDEAKMLGGLGICGRPFCCSSFLSDFAQVSIKMAQKQNLSLNSAKISGSCGRLMCCLKYENKVYEDELKTLPQVDQIVKTPDGEGRVLEVSPLNRQLKVEVDDGKDGKEVKYYNATDIKYNLEN